MTAPAQARTYLDRMRRARAIRRALRQKLARTPRKHNIQTITSEATVLLWATPNCEAPHNDMEAFGKKLSKNPDAAREFLQRAGIVTSDGMLAKAYGG